MDHYHYTYRTHDPDTNEFYIGSRSSKVPPDLDPYVGSMCAWKPKDPGRLIKEVQGVFATRELALLHEIELIKAHVKDPLNRNYHIPGSGFQVHGTCAVYDEYGDIIQVRVDDPQFLSGEYKHVHKGLIRLVHPTTGQRVRVRSAKADKLLSEGWTIGSGCKPNAGKKRIYHPVSGDQKFVPATKVDSFINVGWVLGFPGGYRTINKNGVTKVVDPKLVQGYLDNGWQIGTHHRPAAGSAWMYDPATSRSRMIVDKAEQERLLNDGWKLGRRAVKEKPSTITGVDGSTWMHDPVTGKRSRIRSECVQAQLDLGWRVGRKIAL